VAAFARSRAKAGAGGGTEIATPTKPMKNKKNSLFKDLPTGTVLQNFAQNFQF
jgi:hypothetical protein